MVYCILNIETWRVAGNQSPQCLFSSPFISADEIRAHRRDLQTCWVDSPFLRGCCGALSCNYCPRTHINELRVPPEYAIQNPEYPYSGRTSLYYTRCQYHYRPKFICPQPQCRRMVKPFYDPDRLSYDFDPYGSLTVRPLPSANPDFAAALERDRWSSRRATPAQIALWERGGDLREKASVDGRGLTCEEAEELRSMDADVWWTRLITIGNRAESHEKRCPSCGRGVVRVGSTFRIPGKRDEKGWRRVERWTAEGTDMVARFSYCATVQEHAKMVERAVDH
ncbi:uncharacterized protein ACLA_006790 [Aspergillus clavatus NRRL 1]|uniref:Uncharacterized protein n=1 Tax=Aspergillus clavatus (strain ATCC 1007 / CBS 513.65 / DSM 816 / NCTC 3887 / NRRL 1 / QM 1276 / 107) TaxID=344612 RepID=A1CDJ4_ASPCL|nr:uncharacterized protein ACLA_006790 [Aspergillus clavatus NRRL 1]EAW11921.1 hypothetical protein ACLA_006790 [Aspergillus clavatus NRRL 1]